VSSGPNTTHPNSAVEIRAGLTPTRARSRATLGALLWLFVFVSTSLTGAYYPKPGDAKLMCSAADSLLRHGTLAIEHTRVDVTRGPDGHFYAKYPLMCVVQCVPALLSQRLAASVLPHDAAIERWALGLLPHALAATLALGQMQLAWALGAGEAASLVLGLLVLFTTPLLVSSRFLYSETLQAVLAVYICLAAVRARDATRRAAFVWAGLLCGIALNTKVTWAIFPLAILVDQLHESWSAQRVRNLLLVAAPAAAIGGAVFLAYNQLRYGDPLAQGYHAERDGTLGFAVPLWSGLYGLLFSSGKSVFIYAPLLVLSACALPHWWRRRRRDLLLLALPTLSTLLITARWWAWHGDWAWGPRLVLPVIPLAAVPLLDWLHDRSSSARRLTLALLALCGLYVQIVGISIDQSHFLHVTQPIGQSVTTRSDPALLRDDLLAVHFVPELNPIVGQTWLLKRYFSQARWSRDSDYPWRSLGIRAWRPNHDPTPARLNFWIDGEASRAARVLECSLLVATGLLAWLLIRRVRARAKHAQLA
jgi:hypothetical protein